MAASSRPSKLPSGLRMYSLEENWCPREVIEEVRREIAEMASEECDRGEVDIGKGGFRPLTSSKKSRRVAHFIHNYDYATGVVTIPAPPLPKAVDTLRKYVEARLLEDGVISKRGYFKRGNCIINEYQPGQGISPHIDSKLYGDVIACVTIASEEGGPGREMEFTITSTRGDGETDIRRVYTPDGSVYVMTGKSRFLYPHSMRGRMSDPDPEGGKKRQKRGLVWSVTFRAIS